MRAISLHQPWASLVVLGSKTMETRHWSTDYRGPLLIHAAKRRNIEELLWLGASWQFHAAFHAVGGSMNGRVLDLPFGALVGKVDLIGCVPTAALALNQLRMPRWTPDATDYHKEHLISGHYWCEEMLGNFELGRFAWVLTNAVRFTEPIPYKGSQGFFTVPEEALGALTPT
jgi:activating signal cointegrator 1